MLDETGSGFDVDALKIVSEGVNRFRQQPGKRREQLRALGFNL